jgi:hypothetical protein
MGPSRLPHDRTDDVSQLQSNSGLNSLLSPLPLGGVAGSWYGRDRLQQARPQQRPSLHPQQHR